MIVQRFRDVVRIEDHDAHLVGSNFVLLEDGVEDVHVRAAAAIHVGIVAGDHADAAAAEISDLFDLLRLLRFLSLWARLGGAGGGRSRRRDHQYGDVLAQNGDGQARLRHGDVAAHHGEIGLFCVERAGGVERSVLDDRLDADVDTIVVELLGDRLHELRIIARANRDLHGRGPGRGIKRSPGETGAQEGDGDRKEPGVAQHHSNAAGPRVRRNDHWASEEEGGRKHLA